MYGYLEHFVGLYENTWASLDRSRFCDNLLSGPLNDHHQLKAEKDGYNTGTHQFWIFSTTTATNL